MFNSVVAGTGQEVQTWIFGAVLSGIFQMSENWHKGRDNVNKLNGAFYAHVSLGPLISCPFYCHRKDPDLCHGWSI